MLNLNGRRFGKLVAVSRVPKSQTMPEAGWHCECDCGKSKTVYTYHLTSGSTRSCGCARIARLTTHGQNGSKTHQAWRNMRWRCSNPNNPGYKHYGGRGIKVCDRWKSFANFRSDMGDAPVGLTLERINNDGDYEPGNCRWATYKDQLRNRRINHFITINGSRKTIAEWAEERGVHGFMIRSRIKRGWPPEKAVMRPLILKSAPRPKTIK